MPTRDELLDDLARADRLALAAHLRAEDGPVRDLLVELRARLRELGHAVELRPYRRLRPLAVLLPFTVAVVAGAGLHLVLPWYLAAPLAVIAAAVPWPLRPPRPDVDLAIRDVPVPEAVALPVLAEDLAATVTRVTEVVTTWRLAVRPHGVAALALHTDACVARLSALLTGEAVGGSTAPPAGLDALRPVAPWVHALVHDAAGGPRGRLARMDAAWRLVEYHAPAPAPRGGWHPAWSAVAAGAFAAVVPWPWAAGLLPAVAVVVAYVMRQGPNSCPGLRPFNREADAGAMAVEAARRLEEIAGEAGGPVAEELRRARDLLRGQRRT